MCVPSCISVLQSSLLSVLQSVSDDRFHQGFMHQYVTLRCVPQCNAPFQVALLLAAVSGGWDMKLEQRQSETGKRFSQSFESDR
jgi:hypothetical protein